MILIIAILIALGGGDDLMNAVASRYTAANGFRWTMESTVSSPVFDETETTPAMFAYNKPDTFYFKSESEEIIGVADTVWVMSKVHKQIQKKMVEGSTMPSDFILKWNEHFDIEQYSVKDDEKVFTLYAHPGTTPDSLKLVVDGKNRIKSVWYNDSAGNEVTLTIKKEKLKRSGDIDLFYLHIPSGYKLVDLTQ